MSQLTLKPSDPPVGPAMLQGPVSFAERKLKKVIDLTCLKPGDLLLTSALEPGFIGRRIRRVQLNGGYAPEHVKWEHAAVYVGRGVLVEATRGGVARAMLSKYVGTHELRLRRDMSLDIDTRYEIAIEALSFNDYSYSFTEIIRLMKSARRGFSDHVAAGKDAAVLPRQATICSMLYADSFAAITRRNIGNVSGKETTPASLSAESTLSDIQMNWLSI